MADAHRFISRIGVAALAVAALPLVGLAQALEVSVRNLLANAKLTGAEVGIAVVDCDSGEALVEIDAKRALIPASNLKLVTSGVALSVLGPDFVFKTEFFVEGTKLVIRGAGDPALGDPKLLAQRNWDVPGFVNQIVEAARRAKVSGITEVVVDDRIFDRNMVHPGWPEKQLNLWYCAPVSGLNFHTNVLEIYARNGDRIGGPPSTVTQPSAPWIQIDSAGARTARDGSTSLWAQQTNADSVFAFKLFGTFREVQKSAPREPIEVTISEPGLMFGRLLADGISKGGMAAGPGLPVRFAQAGEQWGGETLFAVVSTPISAVIERCNVDSQNLYAESLIKRVAHDVTGQPGSWANGATIIRGKLQEVLGGDIGDLRISDGSGLSRENQIAPMTLARWLGALHRDTRVSEPFFKSMADTSEGRLVSRFRDRKLQNEVRAKTGFIRGVLCLSGYVRHTASGRTIAFSVMVNNVGNGAGKARELHEDVVEAVDRWLTRQAPKAEPAMGG